MNQDFDPVLTLHESLLPKPFERERKSIVRRNKI